MPHSTSRQTEPGMRALKLSSHDLPLICCSRPSDRRSRTAMGTPKDPCEAKLNRKTPHGGMRGLWGIGLARRPWSVSSERTRSRESSTRPGGTCTPQEALDNRRSLKNREKRGIVGLFFMAFVNARGYRPSEKGQVGQVPFEQ